MLAALGEYASGSDIDVFNIARDLEYGIEEASSDHNILHTLLLFKHYELPWLQNDASGYAKPSWFCDRRLTKASRTRGRHPCVPRQCLQGRKIRNRLGTGRKASINDMAAEKGRLIPIKLPKGALQFTLVALTAARAGNLNSR